MADEARLNELLDLVEQARSEGDKETEAKAISAYRAESGASAPVPANADPAQPQGPKPINQWSSIDDAFDSLKRDVSGAGQSMVRLGQLGIRGVMRAAADTVNLVANPAVAVRDALMNQNHELPSTMTDRAINEFIPPPKNTGEQLVEGMASAATSALLPSGKVPPRGPVSPVMESVNSARGSGYVVPPSQIPSGEMTGHARRFVETVVGSDRLNADATTKNVAKLSENMAAELGLPKGTPITWDSLDAVRNNAGTNYEAIAQLGPTFRQAIDQIKQFRNEASQYMRQNAANYSVRATKLAEGLKNQAETVEKQMETNLKNMGLGDLYDRFVAARQTIAKTYDVEKALVNSRGEVKGSTLANTYEKGAPVTSEIQSAGRSASAFPRAFGTEAKGDFGSLDKWLLGSGIGAEVLFKNPKLTATLIGSAAARAGARKVMLSEPYQDLLALDPAVKQVLIAEALMRAVPASAGFKPTGE